jgi:hypothetical protein
MNGTCAACHQPLRPRARFCGKCGTAVEKSEPRARENVLYVLPASQRRALDGVIPTGQAVWVEPETALPAVQSAVAGRPGAVCLIGDDAALPFARLPDPTGYDAAILSDVPYGLSRPASDDDVLPEIPVTRIPSSDPALVRRLLAVGDRLAPDWRRGLAVSASVWGQATGEVLRQLGADVPLRLSPPQARSEVEGALAEAPGRVYFNVHGTDQDAVWLGEGDGHYPEVLRPPGARVAENAIVFSEACYGATLADGAGSIAPAFLAAGAGCFVGSTIIAWGGGPGSPPCLADEMALQFYRLLSEGVPLAEAVQAARIALLDAALAAGGVVDAPLHNTLLSFVAYGAPSARAAAAPLRAPRAPVTGASALQQARERLRRRLGAGAWQVVSSGRLTMRALAAQFRQGATVARRLEELLGTGPTDAQVTRYRAGGTERATIIASASTAPLPRHAGVRVDRDGRVLESFVSR